MVKKRNIILLYVLWIFTFGIYAIYWLVPTKKEMNEQGAKIPTAWLIIIPIVNIYWGYKYCEGFAVNIKKDNNTILWFVLYLVIGIIIPGIVQSELNKLATTGTSATTVASAKPAVAATTSKPVVKTAQ